MRNRDREDGGNLVERLEAWSVGVAGDSPLYSRLARAAASDALVLDILGEAAADAPVPHLLLAAVHYLLLTGEGGDLATHYPTVTGPDTVPVGDAERLFLDFCASHRERILALVTMRRVQTNEVLRCAALLPAFAVAAASSDRPLSLIEIGPSAGLNLLFDRYRYDYGPAGVTGPAGSPLTLACEVRSGTPPVPEPLPAVSGRVGVDLDPLDPADPSDVDWARALVWPEHVDRLERLEAALALARTDTPPIVQGDAVETLPGLLAAVPVDSVPLVFHSFALNQVSEEGRERIATTLRAESRRRTIVRVAMEMLERGMDSATITLIRYQRGAAHETLLGRAHYHGRWLEWAQR